MLTCSQTVRACGIVPGTNSLQSMLTTMSDAFFPSISAEIDGQSLKDPRARHLHSPCQPKKLSERIAVFVRACAARAKVFFSQRNFLADFSKAVFRENAGSIGGGLKAVRSTAMNEFFAHANSADIEKIFGELCIKITHADLEQLKNATRYVKHLAELTGQEKPGVKSDLCEKFFYELSGALMSRVIALSAEGYANLFFVDKINNENKKSPDKFEETIQGIFQDVGNFRIQASLPFFPDIRFLESMRNEWRDEFSRQIGNHKGFDKNKLKNFCLEKINVPISNLMEHPEQIKKSIIKGIRDAVKDLACGDLSFDNEVVIANNFFRAIEVAKKENSEKIYISDFESIVKEIFDDQFSAGQERISAFAFHKAASAYGKDESMQGIINGLNFSAESDQDKNLAGLVLQYCKKFEDDVNAAKESFLRDGGKFEEFTSQNGDVASQYFEIFSDSGSLLLDDNFDNERSSNPIATLCRKLIILKGSLSHHQKRNFGNWTLLEALSSLPDFSQIIGREFYRFEKKYANA
ncbi:hypothetical protein [Noviherbaspirillum soli]|uniref:hypothetical protein n=1 Tax=Noviherbaspirillum soli TaxID=1064518 RepID=UPI00188A17ED|nr:hypothetical protein [Noviherbaspirillum soli]